MACVGMLASCAMQEASESSIGPLVDHHQHLFRAGLPGAQANSVPLDGAAMVRLLDEAGIHKAVVLSLAYQPGNPNRSQGSNEYALVRDENDWTSQQVSQFPDRLVGFCGLNPLKEYALEEIRRCAGDPYLRAGIKLYFGNSDVQLDRPDHVARLRDVFAEANQHCMAIAVHLHPSVDRRRPYGAAQALAFLESVLPAAPDVVVQIAHIGGAGRYDRAVHESLSVFAEAVKAGDPRARNLYFDVSGLGATGVLPDQAASIAGQLRQVGLKRVLFGSDGAIPGNSPKEAWTAIAQLPLSPDERGILARNVAPYLGASGLAETRTGSACTLQGKVDLPI